MRANNSLLLRFREHVHYSAITRRPIAFGQAMHQEHVEVVGLQLATEAVEVGPNGFRIASPTFGQHRHLVTLGALQSIGNVWVASVRVGGIEESQALVVTVQQQVGKSLYAQLALVRSVTRAD